MGWGGVGLKVQRVLHFILPVMQSLLQQVWDMKTKKIMEDLPGHADEV